MAGTPIPMTLNGMGPAGAIPVSIHGGADGVDIEARVAALEQSLTAARWDIDRLNTSFVDLVGRVEALEAKP